MKKKMMADDRVLVSTDCVCDLTKELKERYQIPVMHYYVKTEEARFQDTKEMTSDDLIEYIEKDGKEAYSSCAPVEEYREFFENLRKKQRHMYRKEYYKMKMGYLRVQRVLKNRRIIIGSILVFLIILFTLLTPFIFPEGPHVMEVTERLKAPSKAHFLGTDSVGRDLLCRLLYGSRVSVGVGAAVAAITMVFGMIIGLYAVCKGR